MQKFFVVSLFLIFSCQSGEKNGPHRFLPKPPTTEKPSRPRNGKHLGTLVIIQNLQSDQSPRNQELQKKIDEIVAKKTPSQRPNCPESGSFKVFSEERRKKFAEAATKKLEEEDRRLAQRAALTGRSYYPGSAGSAF